MWLCIYRNYGSVPTGRVALKLRAGGSNSPGVFMLKSLELDLRMGYNLGTVYAYGKMEEFKGMGY